MSTALFQQGLQVNVNTPVAGVPLLKLSGNSQVNDFLNIGGTSTSIVQYNSTTPANQGTVSIDSTSGTQIGYSIGANSSTVSVDTAGQINLTPITGKSVKVSKKLEFVAATAADFTQCSLVDLSGIVAPNSINFTGSNVVGLPVPVLSNLIMTNGPAPATTATQGAIYVSDGTTGNGNLNSFYYRGASNGSLRLLGGPPNEVIITTLSDFPTPAAGVITLSGTTVYRISGSVNIGANILTSLGAIVITGESPAVDALITSNATALINHTSGFPLQVTSIQLTNSTGPVYNVNGQNSATSNVVLSLNIINGSGSMGTIAGTSRFVLSQTLIANSANGITFSGINQIVSISNFGALNCTGTFTWFTIPATATLGVCQITNGNVSLLVGQTGFNISTTATVTTPPVRINTITINGAGTALVGITKANPKYEFFQCIGILNSIVYGSSGFISTAGVTVDTTGTVDFFDITGTGGTYVFSANSERCGFTANTVTNGELEYTGIKQITAVIQCKISFQSTGGKHDCIFAIWHKPAGGAYSEITESEVLVTAQGSDVAGYCMSEGVKVLSPNDTVKGMVRMVNAGDIKVHTVHIDIRSLAL